MKKANATVWQRFNYFIVKEDPLYILTNYLSIGLHIVLMTGLIWLTKWALSVTFTIG
tara:strand:+ start:1201 stop:1371 length:171 start_codon:yes stop_codon:yes gene_type:complete